MTTLKRTTIAALVLSIGSSAALAHPGHGDPLGLTHGFFHPLSGLDHVLAMIAVGLYATQLGGRALYLLPAAFVTAMIAGGALGYSGVHLPMVEQGIGFSVILLGAAVALGIQMPTSVAMAIVGLFAVFHGHAHGSEGAAAASFLPYAVGFVLATTALHFVGIGLGIGLGRLEKRQSRSLMRMLGIFGSIAGASIVSGWL